MTAKGSRCEEETEKTYVAYASQVSDLSSHNIANYQSRYRITASQMLLNHGYELKNTPKLGYGRYSKVCEGIHIRTGTKVAIKIIDTKKVTEEFRVKFLPREIQCWKKMSHMNLVGLIDAFEENGKVFLSMELAVQGDLLNYVQKTGAQPEPIAKKWMKQLISAICYMHTKNIAHRDLKLENILIFSDNLVKIADFGFCKETVKDEMSSTFCGSKSYSAPEVLLGDEYQPFKADVWSLGVVAFVLVTNKMPYNENVASNALIVEAQRYRDYCYPRKHQLSPECRESIDQMMTFDYNSRPDIKVTMRLPWFRKPDITNRGHLK